MIRPSRWFHRAPDRQVATGAVAAWKPFEYRRFRELPARCTVLTDSLRNTATCGLSIVTAAAAEDTCASTWCVTRQRPHLTRRGRSIVRTVAKAGGGTAIHAGLAPEHSEPPACDGTIACRRAVAVHGPTVLALSTGPGSFKERAQITMGAPIPAAVQLHSRSLWMWPCFCLPVSHGLIPRSCSCRKW